MNKKINPKMKKKTWQKAPHDGGQYGYGECPYCGKAGDSYLDGHESNSEGWEVFECESCGVQYEYRTYQMHRFHSIFREEDD